MNLLPLHRLLSPVRQALTLAVALLAAPLSQAQLTGTSVSDPAIPIQIATPTQGSQYYVLNQDLSVLRRSSLYSTANIACPAPSGLNASGTLPRTLLNDDTNAYLTATASSGTGTAASAVEPGSSTCPTAPPQTIPGGPPSQSLTSNDPGHGRFYVVSAFNGNGPDTLTVFANLNTNTSSTPSLTQQAKVSLDTTGQYTSVVTDVHSSYGLTAITSLKTATSPGNLWVYSPGIQTPFKVLGPGGTPLPALAAFILPSQNNANGDLLVLVNQDGLTSSNLSSPPIDTTPFTIIDLGQLQRTFSAVVSSGATVTLPSVTQIKATTPYYGMLGAVYSPVFHLLYALVASGTSSTSVTQSIIRYDPTTPNAPAETVVADVSNIPFTFGNYPQLALNAAAGTLEILTPSPSSLYHVVVAGKNNTATLVTGTPFPDTNFSPTYIAANGLLGETYIASSSGQVDILTRPSTTLPRATVELYGLDNAIANQTYTLYATTTIPTSDTAVNNATLTFTATPAGGTAFTLGSGPVYTFGATNSFLSATFPSAGVYTIVASAPATANYPAFSSLPLTVTVGANAVTGVYPTTLTLTAPSTSSSTSVNATLTLAGSTYAPTGRIIVSDATGSQVGRYNFTGAATAYPVTVALTLPNGASTLTAIYNGDDQNQTATSNTASITVGNLAKPTLGLSVPATGSAGATLNGTVYFSSTSTTAPTGNILVQSLASGSTTPTTLATVSAATAFAAPTAGVAFTATAPTAGSYTLFASYAGDVTYSNAVSTNNTFITTATLVGTNLSVSAPSSPTAGAAFTTTVTLSPKTTSTIAPTGNITLTATLSGGTATTVATIPAASAFVTGGFASQVTLNTVGSYTLTAAYPGDATYAASTNSIVVAVSAPAKTTPTLGLSTATSATVGDKVIGTLTYTFAGTVIPTGNIIISLESSNGTVTPTVSIPASNARNSLVTAFSYTAPASGVYSVYAKYDGDASFNAAQSTVSTLTVYGAGPTTTALTLSAPAYVQPKTDFNVNVTLTPKVLLQTPISGNVVIKGFPLNSSGLPVVFATVTALQASKSGGILVTGQLPDYGVGGWQLTADYAGDANYALSTATIGTTEFQPTKLALTPPSVAYAGTPANVSVQLLASNPTTGTIFISSTLNGVAGPSATVSSALAGSIGTSVAMTFPSAGTYVLTATYLGDVANGSSIAPSISIVVGAPLVGPQFTLTLDNANHGNKATPLVLQQNSSATEGITLKSTNGFNTPVNLTFAGDPTNLVMKFTDDAGATITSTTPTAAGVHINVRFGNGITLARATPSLLDSKVPALVACGLLGTFLLIRRGPKFRNVRSLRLLGIILAAALSFITLTGFNSCNVATDRFAKITVTATPTTTTQAASVQVADIFVDYLE